MEKPGSLQPLRKEPLKVFQLSLLKFQYSETFFADEENEAKSCSFNLPTENRFGQYIIAKEKSVRGITAVKDEDMS